MFFVLAIILLSSQIQQKPLIFLNLVLVVANMVSFLSPWLWAHWLRNNLPLLL